MGDEGIQLNGGSNNVIVGNIIGVDATGTQDLGNLGDGILIGDSDNNTIGGTSTEDRNIISGAGDGNIANGIQLANASGNVIIGNYIGTDISGLQEISNSNDGIFLGNGNSFARLDGGEGGDDRVRLIRDGRVNLLEGGTSRLSNIERIEVDGDGRTVVIINPDLVETLTDDRNTLIVDGGSDDRVNVRAGWDRSGTEVIDNKLFDVLRRGDLTLKIRSHLLPQPIGVSQMQRDNTTVSVELSQDLDLNKVNLFDGSDEEVEAGDVTLVGENTGPVRGSLVYDETTREFTFVKSGGPLVPDNYTLTIFSREDGVADGDNGILDGDGDGIEGGNFVTQFTVVDNGERMLSIPDIVRAAGQDVDIAGSGGIPVAIDDAAGLTSFEFTFAFNSSLLSVTDAVPGSLPNDWNLSISSAGAGQVTISGNGTTPLDAGPATLAIIDAEVPQSAAAKDAVLSLQDAELNGGSIAVQTDSALQHVAIFGDATGDGIFSIVDAILAARVAFQLDTGFDNKPLIDPTLITDIDGNGTLSIIDAISLARKAFGFDEPRIPDPPAQTASTTAQLPIATDTLSETSPPSTETVSVSMQSDSPLTPLNAGSDVQENSLSLDNSTSTDDEDSNRELDELFSDTIDLGDLTLLQL